jgi:hypothetical protein
MHVRETCTRFSLESSKERDHSEDEGVDGRLGSEWILWLGRLAGVCGADAGDSGLEPVRSLCIHGDEPSSSGATELVMKASADIYRTFLTWLGLLVSWLIDCFQHTMSHVWYSQPVYSGEVIN